MVEPPAHPHASKIVLRRVIFEKIVTWAGAATDTEKPPRSCCARPAEYGSTGCRTAMKAYETLVSWLVLFVCAAGIAASPIAFAGLWAKRWFKISYFIALSFLVIIALRAVVTQGRPWIGF